MTTVSLRSLVCILMVFVDWTICLPMTHGNKVTSEHEVDNNGHCYALPIMRTAILLGCGSYEYKTNNCFSTCATASFSQTVMRHNLKKQACVPCKPYLSVIKPVRILCKRNGLLRTKYIKQVLECKARP